MYRKRLNVRIHLISSVCVILTPVFLYSAQVDDKQLNLFSRASLYSTVSQSLAGAGTAMPDGGMQGLINPALTANCKSTGSLAAGYGRDPVFNNAALPLGVVLTDNNGAMGMYYRFLHGSSGSVHDFTLNFAGKLFEQVDDQGGVDFGMNIRYEQSVWKYYLLNTEDNQRSSKMRNNSVVLDIGFYQSRIMPGLDFALVIRNLTGYGWNDPDNGKKSSGKIGGGHRTIIMGVVYSTPFMGENILLQIPLDIEMTNLFEKSISNKYILRTGLEARISQLYTLRFGYAHAPDDPMDLIKDFDYKNLFFGGVGVFVKPLQLDFFTGKKEWGITATYYY
ncbi:MAG: hypothetical protein LBI42_04455 [Chitinispirillales bacterium]|jgi:hypothetical protein|nr:hypothetical protein [Chitinispirillales bacterium]